jgi:hypothetical protein
MALVGRFFHVGIVVPQLEPAQAHLTEVLGLSWGRVVEIPQYPVRDGDGNDSVVPMRLCYSREQPHIELIEETPGTTWVCNEHSNLHHVGVWSDALTADATALGELGCPLRLAGANDDSAPVDWSMHRDPLGFLVELIDDSNRVGMYDFHFGGDTA